jgi:hypothetical protein
VLLILGAVAAVIVVCYAAIVIGYRRRVRARFRGEQMAGRLAVPGTGVTDAVGR